MTQTKTQLDLVADAWKRLEQVLLRVDGEWTGNGYMVRMAPIEDAVADLRDELIQAGIIDFDYSN
jgi:hypothetical protein